MPQDQAEVVFSAEDREILRSWKQQYAEVSNLTTAINRLNATFAAGAAKNTGAADKVTGSIKRTGHELGVVDRFAGRWAMNMAMSFLSVDSAISRSLQLLNEYKQAYEEHQAKKAGETLSRSDAVTKAFVQGRIYTPEDQSRYKATIQGAAEETSSTFAQTAEAAEFLATGGFSSKEIENGALREVLIGLNAQGALGREVSTSDLIKGMSKFLTANDMEMSAANVRAFMAKLQGTKESQLKITDFPRYAAEASTIRDYGHVDWKDQISILAAAVDQMEGRIADTSFRLITQELTTLGDTKTEGGRKQLGELRRLGLKPSDIDLEGETLMQAMGTLGNALDKVPETEKEKLIERLFTRDASRGIIAMTKPGFRERYRRYSQLGNDDTELARDTALIMDSDAAKDRVAQAKKEGSLDDPAAAAEKLARDTFERRLNEQERAGTITAWRKADALKSFDWMKTARFSDREAVRYASVASDAYSGVLTGFKSPTVGTASAADMALRDLAGMGVVDPPTAAQIYKPISDMFPRNSDELLGRLGGIPTSTMRGVKASLPKPLDAAAWAMTGVNPSLGRLAPTSNEAAGMAMGIQPRTTRAIDPYVQMSLDFMSTFLGPVAQGIRALARPQEITVRSGNVQHPATKTVKGVL